MKCPKCGNEEKQYKIGKMVAGSQRYRCYLCHSSYAPEKKVAGYSKATRQKAIQSYLDGMNLKRIGRQLGINPQAVANWVKQYAEKLPTAIANGGGGTGTGMGLISNFSGSIGLPTIRVIAFVSKGIVIRITTKTSAMHDNTIHTKFAG